MVSDRACQNSVNGFRVRVSDNGDKDRNRVSDDDASDDERCDGEIDKHCGVGVMPRMNPHPSQRGFNMREGERRKKVSKRDRD